MRHLGKLAAVAIATLALITPTAAQAEPGTNANLSDGGFEFVGKATCTWANVPTNANPPNTVTIDKDDINAALVCTNGYWCTVNEDLVISFDSGATISVVDVTCGAFFWCRYRAPNVILSGPPPYTGSFQVPLYGSNWPAQCQNPALVNIWIYFH